MSELRFIEDDARGAPRRPEVATKSKFAAYFIRKGWAKNESQANLIMVVLSIFMAAAIVYINVNTFSGPVADDSTTAVQE